MSKSVKNFILILNLIIIILSIYWYFNPDSNVEPIVVVISQIISIVAILFGDKLINRISINKISDSDVKIDTHNNDSGEYQISNIKKGSKIQISKRNK